MKIIDKIRVLSLNGVVNLENKNIYDIKTGEPYNFLGDFNDDEIIVIDKNGNKIILNKDEVITDKEINNFKNIFKILCKNGSIALVNKKYTEKGKTIWDGGIGTTPCTNYFETSIKLDGKEILTNKCIINE